MHPQTANTFLYILIHIGWCGAIFVMECNILYWATRIQEAGLGLGLMFLFWFAVWYMGMGNWLKGIYIKGGGTKWG